MGRIHTDLVATTNQRPACHIQEAHILSDLFPTIEFYRLHVTVNFHVLLRGAHVLAKCDDINVNFTMFY